MDHGDATESPPSTPHLALSMTVTTIAVAVARWIFSADRRVFHVAPDEPSQLAIARWLAGGRHWNMFDHATWQPALGTLLAPIYWFTDDGETAVRWALGANALIGGFAAAVLVLIARRTTGLSAPWCAVLATIAGVAPASLSATSFIWAEGLVSLTFLATMLGILRFHDDHRVTLGVAAIACAVAGYTSHSRLLPLVGITAVLTVGWAVWRRRWRDFVVLGMSAGVLMTTSVAWTRFVLASVWEQPSDQNTIGAVWERAQRPLAVADSLLGQAWYQLAATIGLAGIGALVLARSAIGRSPNHGVTPTVTDARLIASTTVPLLLTSVVFMADRGRPDQFIYGRYNDAVMWPVIVLGLAWIGRRVQHGVTRRHAAVTGAVAASIVASGFAVDRLHGDAIRERYGVRGMIAGLLAFVDGGDTLDVWRTSLISAGLLVAMMTIVTLAHLPGIPRPARRAVLALGAVLGVATIGFAATRTDRIADLRLNGWAVAAAVTEVDALLPSGATVAVRPVPSSQDPGVEWVSQRQRYQLYQLYLPERTFLRDRGVDDDVGPFVFAPLDDSDLLDAGATVIWRDPNIRIGLWEEPRN
jgi:hypothetical protein